MANTIAMTRATKKDAALDAGMNGRRRGDILIILSLPPLLRLQPLQQQQRRRRRNRYPVRDRLTPIRISRERRKEFFQLPAAFVRFVLSTILSHFVIDARFRLSHRLQPPHYHRLHLPPILLPLPRSLPPLSPPLPPSPLALPLSRRFLSPSLTC